MEEVNLAFDSYASPQDQTVLEIISDAATVKSLGSTLSFHDLNYIVEIWKPCCRSREKQIIHDVSGIFRPGMNAIMGPTGCGKTTLLDILSYRSETKGLSGDILIDGESVPKNYKCMTGYVVQDDVVMGTLTVRENLMFSANLRLPQTMTLSEREEKVESAIHDLGLQRCANTKMGTAFTRGVSGGERKRTNIGMELIISPPLLFLDEPTTGLDANTASQVLSVLHRLSRKGTTIIFSIHQPRFSIFKLFDRLSLLADGRTVYLGEASEALDFFSFAGFECELRNNPADFFLDVINGDSASTVAHQVDNDINGPDVIDVEPTLESLKKPEIGQVLANSFRRSRWQHRLNEDINPILSEHLEKVGKHFSKRTVPVGDRPAYARSFSTQMRYLSRRSILNYLRNPQMSIMQTVITVVFSIIVGIIFLQLPLTDEETPMVIISLLASLNSCVNPWIYLAFNDHILRQLFVSAVRCVPSPCCAVVQLHHPSSSRYPDPGSNRRGADRRHRYDATFLSGSHCSSSRSGSESSSQASSLLGCCDCFTANRNSSDRRRRAYSTHSSVFFSTTTASPAAMRGQTSPYRATTTASPAAMRGQTSPYRATTTASPAAMRGQTSPYRATTTASPAAIRGQTSPYRATTTASPAAMRGQTSPCRDEVTASPAAIRGQTSPYRDEAIASGIRRGARRPKSQVVMTSSINAPDVDDRGPIAVEPASKSRRGEAQSDEPLRPKETHNSIEMSVMPTRFDSSLALSRHDSMSSDAHQQ